jgi:hypothetical protein
MCRNDTFENSGNVREGERIRLLECRQVSLFLQVTKALRESRGIDLLYLLDLGARRG